VAGYAAAGDFHSRLGQLQKAIVMFGIEWLKDGSVVDSEASVLKTEGEVIENAYARAPEVAARLIGHEPDGFRLKDAAGKDLSVHSLGTIRGR
jgi:hypothetical protein